MLRSFADVESEQRAEIAVTIVPQGNLLVEPLRQKPCVAYSVNVPRAKSWWDRLFDMSTRTVQRFAGEFFVECLDGHRALVRPEPDCRLIVTTERVVFDRRNPVPYRATSLLRELGFEEWRGLGLEEGSLRIGEWVRIEGVAHVRELSAQADGYRDAARVVTREIQMGAHTLAAWRPPVQRSS